MDKKLMGKRSRAAGLRFELKVREDLEKQGWIVDKWTNNVEFEDQMQRCMKCNQPREIRGGKSRDILKGKCLCGDSFPSFEGKLVKAKAKFVFDPRSKRRIPMGMSSGFPDFIAFRRTNVVNAITYEVVGVESKMDGRLDKIEKEKAIWLLNKHIFGKILIAKKGTKRGEIEYDEFK